MKLPMGARILVVDDSPTIRKVVAAILQSRAYEALVAHDGQQALEMLATNPVDLVLVDFVMPRMNGYQFCRALRSNDTLKQTPVVLMSAKGDHIRGQFLRRTGALDAITKPFDAHGLVAVVEGALKKQRQGVTRADLDAADQSDVEREAAPESVLASLFPAELDPSQRRLRAAKEFASALADIVVPELLASNGNAGTSGDTITQAIVRAVTAESMGALTSLLRTLDFGATKREVLAGDVSVISISEVLQMLELARQTGALSVATRGSEVTLYLRRGDLDLAMSRGMRDEFLISRYLVENGVVTREQLETLLAERSEPPKLLGRRLVEHGLVSDEQIREALKCQSSELVYETVRWKTGWFSFILGASHPAADDARLGLSTSALSVEGFRRVDEWRLIEGSFDFNDVLYKDEGVVERIGDHPLTKLEHSIIDAIDGRRTVREVVDESHGSSFEACKAIFQFLNSRVVRRKNS
jgi:DNA-binding response OmpR family regulator